MLRLGSSGWCTAASCLGPASAMLSDEDEEDSEEEEGDGEGEDEDEDAVSSRMSMSHSETMLSPTAHSPARIPPSSRKQLGMLQGSDEKHASEYKSKGDPLLQHGWVGEVLLLAAGGGGVGGAGGGGGGGGQVPGVDEGGLGGDPHHRAEPVAAAERDT